MEDSGYFSNANVMACAKAGIAPLIALGRERHNQAWQERLAEAPPAPDSPTPLEAMNASARIARTSATLCLAQADAETAVRD